MSDSIRGEQDLTECDREPIHLLGAVQPHGVLLGVDAVSGIVRAVSRNADTLLGTSARAMLGNSLREVLPHHEITQLGGSEDAWGRSSRSGLLAATLSRRQAKESPAAAGRQLDVSVHAVDGLRILEFEPAVRTETFGFAPYYGDLRRAMFRLQESRSIAEVCDVVVQEVRRVTGYDRVMVYRFAHDASGEVVAEDRREDWEPYLGQRYPASDIPVQARALYERNWIRAIERVDYQPADLLLDADLADALGRPLDLSGSVLRSVSPVHLQYLRNMGVGASMSVSILRDGRLWGLISCHHGSPAWPPSQFRAACELLGVAVSMQVSGLEFHDDLTKRERIARTQGRLLDQMATGDDVVGGLEAHGPEMLDMLQAQGASVRIGDRHLLLGHTPTREQVNAIVAAMPVTAPGAAFSTDCLSDLDPGFGQIKDVASGVLGLRLAAGRDDHLLWLREETLQPGIWAGNPSKQVHTVEGNDRLQPRSSFAAWQHTVEGHSQPWTPIEGEAAEALWRAVSQVMLRRISEIQEANSELSRSNLALEAFAYVASHDLKEPLRGIAHFTAFVLEDAEDTLDTTSRARLESVRRLTERMDHLLDALLHFSRVGQADLQVITLQLDDVIDDALEVLAARLAETGVEVRRPGRLPSLEADAVRIHEVFTNLLSNAIKYRGAGPSWVEIGTALVRPPSPEVAETPASDAGYRVTESPSGQHVLAVYVRDNGIGIPPDRLEDVFTIFRRLHRQDEYTGGAGVGLTIARKIVERHGGAMWARSDPQAGTTFWMTLPTLGAGPSGDPVVDGATDGGFEQ
jgi:chemotaxis family two-component system sensor kinase Cph1